jgi:hypothetical protein
MATTPMTNEADVNIGGSLLAVQWSLAGIAGIVLGMRLFTVTCILQRVRAADYLMVLAFVRPAIPNSCHYGNNHNSDRFVLSSMGHCSRQRVIVVLVDTSTISMEKREAML